LALGAQYQIYNPFTTRAATAGRFQRDPFPGNVIPKSLLSPVGLNLAALYPLPSQASTIDGRNNFFYPDVRQQLYDSYLTRFDHAFTHNHRLFLRMNHFAYEIPKNLLGIPATDEVFNQINRGIALDDVIVLNASMVLNLRYGLTSADFPERRVTQGTDLATVGFAPGLTSLLDPKTSTIPRVAVSGFATLSNWSDGDGANTALTHDWVADLTKLKGNQTFRLGTERFDRLVGAFDTSASSPIAAQAIANYARNPIPELAPSAFAVKGGLTFVNQNGSSRSPYNGNNGDWLPRIGLAWQLAPQTVIRTGYGVYFGTIGVDTFIPIQSGFSQSTPIQATLDSGVTYI